MPPFLYGSDAASLDDDHSSIIFSCACNNAYAETESIAKKLLKKGSAGIVGATKLSWYTVGWSHKDGGGNASIDYYFFDYLINEDETVGQALFDSKLYYLNNFFWWEWESPQNMYDFCLYGDPAMVFEGAVIPGCCVGVRGNASGDEQETLNISDITYLVPSRNVSRKVTSAVMNRRQ